VVKPGDETFSPRPALSDAAGTRKGAASALTPAAQMCSLSHMATNLALDDQLIADAVELGGHRTKREAVTRALEEYVQRKRQLRVLELFGTIEFDPDFDYKRARRSK
jgi:Arc/MetJ family transcription regulator